MTHESTNGAARSQQFGASACARILLMLKAPKRTNHFNQNQKLWVVRLTGAMAAQVRGKYRGKGRYVKAWVKWDKKGDEVPGLIEVPVSQEFYEKIRGDAESNAGYEDILFANDQGHQSQPGASVAVNERTESNEN